MIQDIKVEGGLPWSLDEYDNKKMNILHCNYTLKTNTEDIRLPSLHLEDSSPKFKEEMEKSDASNFYNVPFDGDIVRTLITGKLIKKEFNFVGLNNTIVLFYRFVQKVIFTRRLYACYKILQAFGSQFVLGFDFCYENTGDADTFIYGGGRL